MKNNYILCLIFMSLFSTLSAQTLTSLGVRFPGGKLNSVVGFNASTTSYVVNLSSTQTSVPTVEATAAASGSSQVANATSITGTLEERTATVVVTASDGITTQNYTVTFVKSSDFIQGFTEDTSINGSYVSDGGFNNGTELGNRCSRTGTNANSCYWTLPVLSNGAGKLSLYVTKDTGGTSNLLSTLQIKKSENGGTNWTTVASVDASTFTFPVAGTWEKLEYDLNINSSSATVQINIIKTGTTRDFAIDDIVITSYPTTTVNDINYSNEKSIIYTLNNKIHIDGTGLNEKYSVFDLCGRIINEGILNNSIDLSVQKGIYIVKVNSEIKKVIIK